MVGGMAVHLREKRNNRLTIHCAEDTDWLPMDGLSKVDTVMYSAGQQICRNLGFYKLFKP